MKPDEEAGLPYDGANPDELSPEPSEKDKFHQDSSISATDIGDAGALLNTGSLAAEGAGSVAEGAGALAEGAGEFVGEAANAAGELVGGAAEAAGSVLEGVGGCLEGCAGCSLALLATLFVLTGTAVAMFR